MIPSTSIRSNTLALLAFWCLTCMSVKAESKAFESPFTQHQPGRRQLSVSGLKQGRPTHPAAVAMHHSGFLMDPAFTPRLGTNKTHFLLQLTQPLNQDIQGELHEIGVELMDYIPQNTWKAKITPACLPKIQGLPYIHAVGDIHIADKLPGSLMEQSLAATKSKEGDTLLPLLVRFYGDVPFDRARRIAKEISASCNQEAYISGNCLSLQLPVAHLELLATFDEVNWIDKGSRIKTPYNYDAARLSNINCVQSGTYALKGNGVIIGQWDAGAADAKHPDLEDQIIIQTAGGVSPHATAVAGTLVGKHRKTAGGMAPKAILYSYDYQGDVPMKMRIANCKNGVMCANHSWGYATGWEYNLFGNDMWVWMGDERFNWYTSISAEFDEVIRNRGIISVHAAGNDRDDMGVAPEAGHYHWYGSNQIFYDYHPPDGDFGCISDVAAAKNAITVGAVNDDGSMTPFSSWGPVHDGRVKPDLVANGAQLITTRPGGFYMKRSGTSYSAAVVSGGIALLVQAYQMIMGDYPSPAMVKALLVNTAVDLGEAGPDYRYGWGLMDLVPAIDILNSEQIFFYETYLATGAEVEFTIQAPEDTPDMKVTVAWADMEGSPCAAKALVNDIDLAIIDPEGFRHDPWVLDRDKPDFPAATGLNSFDNVEQVAVMEPCEGEWHVRVMGTQIQNYQDFAMVSNLAMLDVARVRDLFLVLEKPYVDISVKGSDEENHSDNGCMINLLMK